MKMPNAVKVPTDAVEIKDEAKDTLKDTKKPTEGKAEKPITKHVIVYLGNGEYIDSVGNKWHKHDEHTYSEEEYESRIDLHFMVKYGEMKHTAVTM